MITYIYKNNIYSYFLFVAIEINEQKLYGKFNTLKNPLSKKKSLKNIPYKNIWLCLACITNTCLPLR